MSSNDENSKSMFQNEYFIGAFSIFVLLYLSKIRMPMPDKFSDLFKNDYFRILYLSLFLIIVVKKSPFVSLIVALIFVIGMKQIADKESFENVKEFNLNQ
tara:strand:+ start:1574 stop:1873 length:300 start_codon:yes stop_codon:yes gene_type:complete